MPKKKTSQLQSLDDLKEKVGFLHPPMRNLAYSLGVFHGLNDSLRDETLSGSGAGAVDSIMFDLIHLIAIRTHALIVEPRFPTDVSLATFASALLDGGIKQQVIDDTACWYGASYEQHQRGIMSRSIDSFLNEFAALRSEEANNLRLLRNKVLAHVSTEAKSVPTLVLQTLWDLGERTLSLGNKASVIFSGADKNYDDELKFLKKEAQNMIGLIRTGQKEEERLLQARRDERRSRHQS